MNEICASNLPETLSVPKEKLPEFANRTEIVGKKIAVARGRKVIQVSMILENSAWPPAFSIYLTDIKSCNECQHTTNTMKGEPFTARCATTGPGTGQRAPGITLAKKKWHPTHRTHPCGARCKF